MEIVGRPSLTEEQIFEVEMHTFINILNVISAQLQLIRMLCRHPSLLDKPVDETGRLARAIGANRRELVTPERLSAFAGDIRKRLASVERMDPDIQKNSEYAEYLEIFEQIFRVLDLRIEELYRRWDNPGQWEAVTVEAFRNELIHFLGVIERNSRGRYRIVYNIAEQEQNDYLIHVNISSESPERLTMPLLVKDSIRDLIANARKYTLPGGKIDIGLSIRDGILRFVVEDSGRGIEPAELQKVVNYGYRGSNVMDEVRTMGRGIGLTKTHYVVTRFSGRLWIESRPGKGTTVRFEIPIPVR